MKRFNPRLLIPIGFLLIAFYCLAFDKQGWGWAFFLAWVTYEFM